MHVPLKKWLRGNNIKRLMVGSIWLVATVVALFPLFWMLVVSLAPMSRTMRFPPPNFTLRSLTLSSYVALFRAPRYYAVVASIRNSIVVSLATTVITAALGSLGAYGFARFEFPMKRILFTLVVLARVFPLASLLIPLFLVLRSLHLINTLHGLIMLYVVIFLPMVVWFMRGYFLSLPPELEDAARIDGCNEVQVLYKVVAPTALPGLVAAATLVFFFAWGEFMFAFVVLYSDNMVTIPVRLAAMSAMRAGDSIWNPILALGMISTIVPLALAMIFQREIVSGLTAGAVKG
jgi:multiple sugar transport system permease protein